MKKNFRELEILALTGMLAISQASTAFAAIKQSGSGMSGDIDLAKDQLIQLEAVQEKQIKIRTELVELLEAKIKYLNGIIDSLC